MSNSKYPIKKLNLSKDLTLPLVKLTEDFPAKDPNIILKKQFDLLKTHDHNKKTVKSKSSTSDNQKLLTNDQLRQIILRPNSASISHLKNLVSFKEEVIVKDKELPEINVDFNEEEVNQPVSLVNLVIGSDIFDKHIPEELKKHKCKKILLLTDSDKIHVFKSYKKLINSFKDADVHFVEYTNIQPNLNKKLIWKISKFAIDNDIDTVFAFGSYSLIDLSKVIVIKLTKKNIYNLHKINTRYFTESPFKCFSLSTVVCVDSKINACTAIKCNAFFKSEAFTNTISLLTSIDNSDVAFFYPEILLELPKSKLFEVLHETYFRTMLNFFASNNTEKIKNDIVEALKILRFYLRKLKADEKLSLQDIDYISVLIMKTIDGSSYIDDISQWRWFSLECSLSLAANSPKYKNLALFAPNYFKYESKYDQIFKAKALNLGKKLFNTETIDGLVLHLIKYNEEFNLPKSLLDITQIKKVTPALLLSMTKKASYFVTSYKSSKAIVHRLPIW